MNAANFETTIQDKPVRLFHLYSQNISCFITNYGARVVSLSTLDKDFRMVDVVLGFDSIEGYLNANGKYHGATIGRYANRIAGGTFQLNGATHILAQNKGGNSIHGGSNGFHNKVWTCISHNENEITLELISPHMEEGFPGELTTQITYKIQGSSLLIEYRATSLKDTIINLTNHSFFNLNGEGSGTILNHTLLINSDYYTPVNENFIPIGSVDMVSDTPFDFTKKKEIGLDIDQDNVQLNLGHGYDHNFVLNQYVEGDLNLAAKVIGDKSNIKMEVWTTEPGIQFYTANHLNGSDTGKSGEKYTKRTAFCLETQHFPDSPNQSKFPSTTLKANQNFLSRTEYRFSIV